MDPDDAPGYIVDELHSFAKKHNIKTVDDFYSDDIDDNEIYDLVIEQLKMLGIIK